ncbi:MAG: hypothetical protein ABI240_19230 [Sphingomonas sp.]
MATVAGNPARIKPISADAYEKFLAITAILLLATVLTALVRGRAHWGAVPWPVWAHLTSILTALVLTPVQLLRRRGDPPHRLLGTVWVVAIFLAAAFSFLVRGINHGGFSFIHILSAYVIVSAPVIWWSAHTHRIAMHRGNVRGMITGALLIAGFFTLPFGRLLGSWLFG